jgi:hypothetical protein
MVVGEEAHIIGAKPGSARFEPRPLAIRDGYENRILLCPTHHAIIDGLPEDWPVGRLEAVKTEHERRMTKRTADARGDGLEFDLPPAVLLETVMTGQKLLNIVGPAFAYIFDQDELASPEEHRAGTELLGNSQDWGEIYSDLSVREQMEGAEALSTSLLEALQAGLILRGTRLLVDVAYGETRDRWPVAILHRRRAEDVAAEQKASEEAEAALADGGIEGLEEWAKRARRARDQASGRDVAAAPD